MSNFVIIKIEVKKVSILTNLNKEQLSPVLETEGAVLVTAGAGSGKTRLLTHRIAYLIQEKGVMPYNILAITFTNKAANEMKERVEKMLDGGANLWISTFHSLCVKILRRDIDKLGYTKSFSIYADDEKSRVFKEIFKNMEIEDQDAKKEILFHIARAKNNNLNPKEYFDEVCDLPQGDSIIKAYESYQEKLKKSNALDFDDLLLKTYELLVNFPDVLIYYQNMFRYIHIDEFQDTNKVQYELVKLLAGKWKNIMAVGDEDQCIYGWRGANIENITNFQKDFKPVKIFKLEQNFRSTKNIVGLANKVISNNKSRIKKTLWTENFEGDKTIYKTLYSDKDEAEFVVQTISDLVRKQGYSCKDIAILMRLNALSRNFEFALNNANLPYKVLGGFKFFERAEIKNVVAYLRLLMNPFDEESLIRIINFPKRGIGETTIEKLKALDPYKNLFYIIEDIDNYANSISTSTLNKIKEFRDLLSDLRANINLPVSQFVELMITRVNFASAYDKNSEEDISKLLNIDQFVQSVKEFEEENKGATLDEFLQSVMLLTDLDSANLEENFVLVSTIHAVKGLEFKVVFVVGTEEGIFPIIRGTESENDIEEERRLMYVAITRAKESLFLTNAQSRYLYNRQQFQKPSRFLFEAGLEKTKPKTEKKEDFPKKAKNTYLHEMQTAFMQKQVKNFSGYTKGTQVFHPKYGVGVITDDSKLSSKHQVTVTFNVLGAKTLSLEYAPLKIIKN